MGSTGDNVATTTPQEWAASLVREELKFHLSTLQDEQPTPEWSLIGSAARSDNQVQAARELDD